LSAARLKAILARNRPLTFRPRIATDSPGVDLCLDASPPERYQKYTALNKLSGQVLSRKS
jgi:hypothetical protein